MGQYKCVARSCGVSNTSARTHDRPSEDALTKFRCRAEHTRSWLPKGRREAICGLLDRVLVSESLHDHRATHTQSIQREHADRPCEPNKPAWVTLSPTSIPQGSDTGTRLIVGFSNDGCGYRRTDPLRLGCFDCGFYAGLRGTKGAARPRPDDGMLNVPVDFRVFWLVGM